MNRDFYKLIQNRLYLQLGFVFVFLLSLQTIAFAQPTVERTIQCQCIDNDAPEGLAQFLDEITVSSGGDETWYIANISGLYQVGSPVPPAPQTPFIAGPNGYTLNNVGNGDYVMQGISIEGIGYSLELTNGSDTVNLDNIVCEYPSAEILGDNAICDGEVETYENLLFDDSFTYSWSVGKGVIIGSNTGQSINVDWNDNASGGTAVFLNYSDPNGCGGSVQLDIEFEEQIVLACNNLNNHTVGPDCIVNLQVSDILEGMEYNDDSYNLVLKLVSTGEIIEQGENAGPFLFQQIEASIEHICGENSCWGYIQLEDKYIPPLLCENDTLSCTENINPENPLVGFPLPDGTFYYQNGPNQYVLTNFDGCGDAYLSYEDQVVVNHCATDFYSVTTRTWIVEDEYGNSTSCIEKIYQTRTTVDDVVFPLNYDGIDLPPLQCDADFPMLPSGFPDPSFTGFPTEGVCGHLAVSYVDLPTQICGAMYKLVRKWKIFDPCTNQTITQNQIIKITDEDGPEFYCPPDFTVYIEENNCAKDVELDIPAVIFDCSEVSFIAKYYKLDKTGNIDSPIYTIEPFNGKFYFNDLVESEYLIEFVGEDECGNKSSCDFILTVKDGFPPTAVCDQVSSVSLNEEGFATVPASLFDGGSYDNCSDVSLSVKRMEAKCGPNSWGPTVTFCCADVGVETLVQLRVTDASGNYNICMVEVEIQDKKPPIMQCPEDITLDCDADKENLDVYGTPYVTDNCSFEVEEFVNEYITNCGTGQIIRTFVATDIGGNTSSCQQVLYYQNPNPITEENIQWPEDYTTNMCEDPELDPDNLPDPFGYPIVPNNTCSEIGFNYFDKVYTNISGSCKTIKREWTLVDLCSNQYYYDVQFLYIDEDEKPVFDECSDKLLDVVAVEDCKYQVNYSKEASDNCTPESHLVYSYDIDIGNDGFIEIWKPGNTIDTLLPAGTHKVIWRVEDDCGNFGVCTELITIKDQKAPTPYCIDGISTVVMQSTGSIEIWASDFDQGSFDNCTDQEDLMFSFTESMFDQSMVYTCDDLDGEPEKFFDVTIYVFDESGNFDFCNTTLRVTSNGHCDSTGMIVFDIGGKIKTVNDVDMEQANVTLMNMYSSEGVSQMSNDLGQFSFPDMQAYNSYELTANYDDDPLNGVTTLDIILIQKHILQVQEFKTTEEIIAADVNESETITGSDIIFIRKLILGLNDEFPTGASWTLVDENAVYPNPLKPWPIQKAIYIDPLEQNKMDNAFTSIKLGDVNYSHSMGLTDGNVESRIRKYIEFSEKQDENGTLFTFYTNDPKHFEGFQAEMTFGMNLSDVEIRHKIQGDISQYFAISPDGNNVKWSYNKFAEEDGYLFEIYVPKTSDQQAKVQLTNSEIYMSINQTVKQFPLGIKARTSSIDSGLSWKVYPAQPNPFKDQTTVSFELEKEDNIQLSIYNLNGQKLYEQTYHFEAGENELIIRGENIGENGLLIYNLSGEHGNSVGKILRIQ